ncbi:MAG: pyridoxal phosphate-dependent aminotransferase [Anaerolineae bacterium]|jgi:aspartate aminotransferase|nr:pyridoxal phosphate-dependent aminotransferase [Chloroflexota bacterium]
MFELADCMSRLGTESAFQVLSKARALEAQGRDVIHLEIGEPDFNTPAHIIEAACRALHEGWTHYTPSAGIPELTNLIAEQLGERRRQPISPAQVVVTPGGKPIMFFTLLALAQPGREVIYPDPGFPIYRSMIEFCGAKAVPLPLREDLDFAFQLDELKPLINDRTALIILNSPQNPTGGIIEAKDLKAVAEICAEHNIPVLSDEIYEQITYDGEFQSISTYPGMSTSERTIILHGFSKTYAMTGWRLGYGVMPEWLAEHIKRLMVNSNSCTNAATQWAGVAALTGSQEPVAEMVAAFRQRRDVIVEGLNSIPGITCRKPRGAFYVFPNITGTGLSSQQCEDLLLQEAGVAALSGTSFGIYGEGYLRLSYANSVENIEKAIERIRATLARA